VYVGLISGNITAGLSIIISVYHAGEVYDSESYKNLVFERHKISPSSENGVMSVPCKYDICPL